MHNTLSCNYRLQIAIPKANTPVDLSQAIAGLVFREITGDEEW